MQIKLSGKKAGVLSLALLGAGALVGYSLPKLYTRIDPLKDRNSNSRVDEGSNLKTPILLGSHPSKKNAYKKLPETSDKPSVTNSTGLKLSDLNLPKLSEQEKGKNLHIPLSPHHSKTREEWFKFVAALSQFLKQDLLIDRGFEGPITLYTLSGSKQYEGQYKNGVKFGKWKRYLENGELSGFESYNEQGQRDGRWENLYNGKPTEILNYKNGELEGYYEFRYKESGKLRESATYKAGLIDGRRIRYHENGVIESSHSFNNGVPVDGPFTAYHSDGKTPKTKGFYKNGARDSTWEEFFNDGTREELTTYTENIRNGASEDYHHPGQVYSRGRYLNDNKIGEWRSFHENGLPASIENYDENGKEHGKYITYSSHIEGLVTYESTYVHGKEIGEIIERDDLGNIVKITEATRPDGSRSFKEFYPNGSIEMEGTLLNDSLHGLITYYDRSGNVSDEKKYEKGKLVK